MRILFVNSDNIRVFDKLDSGAAMRTHLFIKALAQLGHVDLISFSNEDLVSNIEGCDVINAGQYIKTAEGEKKRSIRGKAWLDMLFKPSDPYTYFHRNRVKEQYIDRFIHNHDYDFIACRYIDIAVSYGLIKYSEKLIIDVDDNPINVCMVRDDLFTYKSIIKRWKNALRGRLIGRAVEDILGKSFCSFYSSPLEPPSPKSVLLYNTVASVEKIPDITDSTTGRLLFIGGLDYPPNKQGIKHFATNVFPSVKLRFPNAELIIVGKSTDDLFIEELDSIGGVKMLGFVDDIAKEYEESRVVVIPVYHGSGTSVKFIEAIMMNRPIVSTPTGARGFEHICHDGEHFLLAKDDKEFADRVIDLLSSPNKSLYLAHNALEAGERHFSQYGFRKIVRDTVLGQSYQ